MITKWYYYGEIMTKWWEQYLDLWAIEPNKLAQRLDDFIFYNIITSLKDFGLSHNDYEKL